MAPTNGTGDYSAAGPRRFATGTHRVRKDVNGATPPFVSARGYLRSGLPAVYQEGDFGLRFVGALETLLDPIVGLLDTLPAHFTPDLAPEDVLELLGAWVGIDFDEHWPEERRRELARRAGELGRQRGTRAGLESALKIAFPHLPLRVEDGGSVRTATDVESLPAGKAPEFVVYCDAPIEEHDQASVARMIEQVKPVHVKYRLRVKAKKSSSSGSGSGGAAS